MHQNRYLIFVFCALIPGFALTINAQKTSDEKQLRAIYTDMDRALVAGDITVFEKHFAPDYIYSNNFGIAYDRVENLAHLRNLFSDSTFKVLDNRSDPVVVRVNGNSAIVTADWSTTAQTQGDPNALPHLDKGRFTSYFEKRNGRWLVVREHSSEKRHDRKMMEQQLVALGRKYSDMIRRNDVAAIRLILADDYLLADEEGKVFTKEQDLATYKDRATSVRIDKIEYLDQKIQVISDASAVDHSTIRFLGERSGKPFDITERSTTVWTFNDGRWQIAADHFSYVKP